MTTITLLRLQAPYFTAGVVIAGGMVVRTAPILKYMLGWEEGRVWEYAAYKGWGLDEI